MKIENQAKNAKINKKTCFFQYPLLKKAFGIFSVIFHSRETLGSILTKKFIDQDLQALQALDRDFGGKSHKNEVKLRVFFNTRL